jgi:hypothetical protein
MNIKVLTAAAVIFGAFGICSSFCAGGHHKPRPVRTILSEREL